MTPKTHSLVLALLVGSSLVLGCGGSGTPAPRADASTQGGGAGASGSTANTGGTTGAGGQTTTGASTGGSSVGGSGGSSASTGGVATGGVATTGGGGGQDTGQPGGNTQTGGTTETGGTAAKGGSLDSQQVETTALSKHAKLLMEVLNTRDAASPTGWATYVSIKRLDDGIVLAEGYMDGSPPEGTLKPPPRFEADPRGGFREIAAPPMKVGEVGKLVAEQTLARLGDALAAR